MRQGRMPHLATGSVQALHRYPVKSMAGEALTTATVLDDHGLQGDRAFALIDAETGRVASAKHPRRWGRLLEHRARFVEPLAPAQRRGPVAITLPDGTVMQGEGEATDRALSASMGRTVRLSATPPPQARYDELVPDRGTDRGERLAVGADAGTFFDFAPIHLVTTSSLRRLAELGPSSRFDVRRFRPNLVIDTADAPGFVETDWLGHVVAIGPEVRIFVSFPCPRCVITTLAQDDLPADPGVLRTATHNTQLFALLAKRLPTVGAYASIVRGGTIRIGDSVHVEGREPLRRAAAFAHAVRRAIHRR